MINHLFLFAIFFITLVVCSSSDADPSKISAVNNVYFLSKSPQESGANYTIALTNPDTNGMVFYGDSFIETLSGGDIGFKNLYVSSGARNLRIYLGTSSNNEAVFASTTDHIKDGQTAPAQKLRLFNSYFNSVDKTTNTFAFISRLNQDKEPYLTWIQASMNPQQKFSPLKQGSFGKISNQNAFDGFNYEYSKEDDRELYAISISRLTKDQTVESSQWIGNMQNYGLMQNPPLIKVDLQFNEINEKVNHVDELSLRYNQQDSTLELTIVDLSKSKLYNTRCNVMVGPEGTSLIIKTDKVDEYEVTTKWKKTHIRCDTTEDYIICGGRNTDGRAMIDFYPKQNEKVGGDGHTIGSIKLDGEMEQDFTAIDSFVIDSYKGNSIIYIKPWTKSPERTDLNNYIENQNKGFWKFFFVLLGSLLVFMALGIKAAISAKKANKEGNTENNLDEDFNELDNLNKED